jgi:formylglycine-generating enzyme required for sulfatase activity
MSDGLSATSNHLFAPRPIYPYPGLRPFEAEEWSVFFGRERMIDDVVERLAAHRLVLVHGASGAGKSSLVRAGVLPKLAREHLRAGATWRTCSMRPAGGPLWNLAKEFARLEGSEEDAECVGRIAGQFNRRGVTLSTVAASLKSLERQRLCILVDQFEELFRFEKETSREEAELFVDLLVSSNVEAAQSGGKDKVEPQQEAAAVHVVVTMRSEFLGECARFTGLAEMINRAQYLVPRMDHDALLRAIRRPAQLYGGEVTLDLAERLIADAAGREDELPLIQHGLMLMWHEAAKMQPCGSIVLGTAPLEAARGLEPMLSAHADRAVEAAAPDPERRYAVERLFRAITDVNIEGRAIRRPQAFRELVAVTGIDDDKLRGIIDALRRDGISFLTPYEPQPIADGTPIDVSHEALIRCWDRLAEPQNGWLKREFDDGLIWRSLLVEARSFERDNRRVLSLATTDERSGWWRDRQLNAAWAERYGGNFDMVERLLAASRKAEADATRGKRLLQAATYLSLVAVIIGLVGWMNQAYIGGQWRWWTSDRPFVNAQIWPYVLSRQGEQALKAGDSFRECAPRRVNSDYCPDMVVIQAGSFLMGSPPTEQGRDSNEGPQHQVTIAKPFAVSKFQLTFDEWDTCVARGDCVQHPSDAGWGRGQRPVIYVSWEDAQQYVAWLSKVTGKPYRLLTEAEYEYAARGGRVPQTVYPWGNDIGRNNASCKGCGSQWDNMQTAPVGSFDANGFGLYGMVGNVYEWVEDCFHPNYNGAPTDGSAWTGANCLYRVVRGGSWFYGPVIIRSAYREKGPPDGRHGDLGFRVGRTLISP